jgi:hypothetical protein
MTEEELTEYYKDAALDSLLYWTNSTAQLVGYNGTLTLLLEMLATAIEQLVPPDQVDRAENVIYHVLDESFEAVKNSSSDPKVSVKKSDKKDMN